MLGKKKQEEKPCIAILITKTGDGSYERQVEIDGFYYPEAVGLLWGCIAELTEESKPKK